jgi:hypothetical protein
VGNARRPKRLGVRHCGSSPAAIGVSWLVTFVKSYRPEFTVLVDTAIAVSESLPICPDAIRASANQLGAVGSGQLRRSQTHPCPDAELAERLQGLIERHGFIGRSFEAPAEEYGEGHLPTVTHQLRVLIADLAVFLADRGHAIEGR